MSDKATPATPHNDWTTWIKSEDGRKASDPSTLRGIGGDEFVKFLENRLWHAFNAGASPLLRQNEELRSALRGLVEGEKCYLRAGKRLKLLAEAERVLDRK